MSKQQSNQHRYHECNDNPKQFIEKQKESEYVAVSSTVPEPRALTNIHYDCLERICDFLDLKSLLNVAGTCKRLKIAACAKFGDDFGHKKVSLLPNWSTHFINTTHGEIVIYSLKVCLSFLRCFGAKILNLRIYYYSIYNAPNDHLDRYINQYCANTLASVEFRNKSVFSSEIFVKPFEEVKKITIFGGFLGLQLPNFVNWFPNLHQLDLSCVVIDGYAIEMPFPHLKQLTVEIPMRGNASAHEFLRVNRQLLSLDIVFTNHMTFEYLLDMISESKFLLKLELKIRRMEIDVSTVELSRFINEHPLMEELIFHSIELDADDAITLIRHLNSLKRFEFLVKDQTECNRFINQLDTKWKSQFYPVVLDGERQYVKVNVFIE